MAPRSGARGAAQDELVAHEFAVVLAERSRDARVPRIADVWAAGPLPDVAIQFEERPDIIAGEGSVGMKVTALLKVTGDRLLHRGGLPFVFGW